MNSVKIRIEYSQINFVTFPPGPINWSLTVKYVILCDRILIISVKINFDYRFIILSSGNIIYEFESI